MRMLPLIFIGFLSGCAAIMSGSNQSVTVVTPGASESECSLTDSKGRVWYIESTPGNTLVKKGDGPISVICKKEGYEVGVGQIKENIAMSTTGNILFPVGFFIDGLTGASQKYQSTVEIEMEPLSKSGVKKSWE